MKKQVISSLIILMTIFVLAGCGNNNVTNDSSNNNSQNNTNMNTNNSKTNNDSLTIKEIRKNYDNDLPLGLENNYVNANGNEIVIRVQTSGSSKQQLNGPYYIYYNVYVGNDSLGLNCVRDAIYHLEGYGITMLKEFDEEDAGVNYEFFEWDMTSSTHKGTDKDYVAISLPAGIEDKTQASLLITTDNGKLLGEFIADVVHDTALSGPDVEKYKNHSGDIVFNSIKNGNISYLIPTDAMYTKDENGKMIINSSLDIIELEEHSVTMNNNKAIDIKTGNIYKITNATGKIYNFGEFRHL